MKDRWYHLDDSKIEFKSILIIISVEHQDTSSLINVHIIDNVNDMSTL